MNLIFWKLFRELIAEKKLTQTGIARTLGIEVRTFQDWVYSKKLPDVVSAKKIAEYLGVSLDYLLTGESSNYTPEELEILKTYKEIQEPLRKVAKEHLQSLASIKTPVFMTPPSE